MKKIILFLLILALALSAVSCGKAPADDLLPPDDSVAAVSLHTEAQAAYLAGDPALFSRYASGKEELSRPLPVVLRAEDGAAAIELYEGAKITEAIRLPVSGGQAVAYNLLLGTGYSYRSLDAAGEQIGSLGSFITEAQAPRNLDIGGVTNARDLGGWQTADGRIRQGMLFRTAKYNADESSDLLITEEGIETMTKSLGIRTEIDLRMVEDNESGGITASPLGEGVNYIAFPMQSGGNILTLNKDRFAALFALFADEANYPIAFHCSIGTDRTGAVAFLIGALLGMSEEDLSRDYLFSNFGEIGGMRTASAVKNYLQTIKAASGNTLAEKARNYLLSVGVAAEDLDALCALMHG